MEYRILIKVLKLAPIKTTCNLKIESPALCREAGTAVYFLLSHKSMNRFTVAGPKPS